MVIENLGLEVRVLSNLIYNKLNQMTMETEGVSIHQCWILQHLTENADKEIYQKDIGQLFSIKRATANQMLRTLEAEGYSAAPFPQTMPEKTSSRSRRKGLRLVSIW